MEFTEKLVRTWVASGRDEEIDGTVGEIVNGTTTLINVVKALGEYLTSEDDELRRKGVEFLSLVLGRCPAEKINRQSARVLTNFFCAKLDDTETIIPALKGLATLVKLQCFTSPDAATVIQGLFQHVKMKALVQTVRFMVFTIIDTLMANHRATLKAMSKDFVAGYIALADGEKDPRNLIIAFAIDRVLLIEFDTSDFVESLFDTIFCYFPITYRPPPNDPSGVTNDDLRHALRECLNATPAFGPLAIPIFLDKLATGSRAAKRDALQALSSCLPVYGAALARASARKLWNALKLEVFQPIDTATEEEALKTMQILIQTIYLEEEMGLESDQDIQGLARDACEECLQILQEPEKSQAKPATKILCNFMTTTPSVSRYTITQAVPHLVKIFLNPDEASNRPPVLVLLSEFVAAARDSTFQYSAVDDAQPLLMPFKDEVLGVFTVGIKTSNSRRPALSGLKAMIMTHQLLSDEELGFIVHNVNEVMEVDLDEWDDTSDSLLDLLSTVSTISPRHVEEQTLPLFFSFLPDTAPHRNAAAERAKCWRILLALSTLCLQPDLFETLVVRLTTKLELICLPAAEKKDINIDDETDAAYAYSILKTISQTLSIKVEKGHTDVPKYADRLIPRIFYLFVYSALESDEKCMIAVEPRLVEVSGAIISLVTQTLAPQRQQQLVVHLFRGLLVGEFSGITEGHRKLPLQKHLLILSEASSPVQKNLIFLFSAAIITLHKEVNLPVDDIGSFIQRLISWSLVSDNELQRESALHIVCSITNKRVDDLLSFVNGTIDDFWGREIVGSERPRKDRLHAIRAWIWISKALLVQRHPLSERLIDRLFEAFGNEDIGWDAAKAIGEMVSSDLVLTKKNNAVIKFLYAQRFVNQVLPRIISGAKDSDKIREKTSSLVALSFLIKSVPKATYVNELSSLMPLLLRSLDLPDDTIRRNVIETFLVAAEGDSSEKSIISEHAPKLVTYMLKNSLVKEMPSMGVRVAALRYLAILPTIVRYDVLHPYKSTVIRGLADALDDPKRSVRREAVDARTSW